MRRVGILVPQPGIEPTISAVEAQSSTALKQLVCTLFLLLLHQLHLRSSGIRSWKLGIPAPTHPLLSTFPDTASAQSLISPQGPLHSLLLP